MKKTLVGLIMLVMAGVGSTGPAWGQRREIVQLQADIIRLSQQVGEIQSSLDERNTVVQNLVEQLYDQVVTLSDTVGRINNTLNEVRASNERLGGEMRVLVGNLRDDVEIMDRSLGNLRTDMNGIAQQLTTFQTTTEELDSPQSLMRMAVTDFLSGNYDLAIEGFREYLDNFPASPRAAESQLYLGDSYFNDGEFEQAIIEYDLLLQKYPDSDKNVTALYKKGLALAEMNQTQDALNYLRRVVSEYPDSTEATSAQQKIDDLSGGR